MLQTQLPLPASVGRYSPARQASNDLALVAGITLAAFVLSSAFELREWLTEATRPLEAYQIDELPLTLGVLALALAWFAWRRWQQAEHELGLRVATQKQLADSLAENRLLSQRYLQVQEDERRTLARELHDELGQCLNAIKLDAVSIRDSGGALPPQVQTSAGAIIEVANHVYEVVRSLMRRLRPVALDELGLHDALEHSVSEWRRRNPRTQCSFHTQGPLNGLGESLNMTLYRLVQECLTNVAKHAHAKRVEVNVEADEPSLESAARVRLVIQDDGRGMDPQQPRTGLGLIGLRERVEASHGTLELDSGPGRGMRVTAVLPLTQTEGA